LTRNEQQGTRDISAFLAVPRGIEFQREYHWDLVRQSCHERLMAFRERQHARTGIPFIVPNEPGWFSQLALVEVMVDGDAATLKHNLLHRHGIEIPCMTHNGITCVRLSVQGYVTDEDLDTLEAALIAESGG
jgi:isopenicillin-N epimerase